MKKLIGNNIYFLATEDPNLDLFEGQYEVPNGVSYNSYVIKDEKIAILDTVDARATEEWLANLEMVLENREPDYLIISHLEPDHSANITTLLNKYPNMKIVGNSKTFMLFGNFVKVNIDERKVLVDEKSELTLGEHTLKFVLAPMVHWPEVMMEYEVSEKILFSADAFGRFGKINSDDDWVDEARRYYFNIVGKYGSMVQSILKKVAPIEVKKIAPLHGPVLEENLVYYRNKYNIWSSYLSEDNGVTIACASIHGNTMKLAKMLEQELMSIGVKVELYDLSRCSLSKAVASAFRYNKLVLASSTYDGAIFSPMMDFIHRLKAKNYQNREVAFIENGTWAPVSARMMKDAVSQWSNIKIKDEVVTIRSTISNENIKAIDDLVKWSRE